MVADKRLETLQEEIKLLKGELKHSLASVRDYLPNQELPSAELSALGNLDGGEQRIAVKSLDSPDAAAGLDGEVMASLPGEDENADAPPDGSGASYGWFGEWGNPPIK
jgi:hypothetical protein